MNSLTLFAKIIGLVYTKDKSLLVNLENDDGSTTAYLYAGNKNALCDIRQFSTGFGLYDIDISDVAYFLICYRQNVIKVFMKDDNIVEKNLQGFSKSDMLNLLGCELFEESATEPAYHPFYDSNVCEHFNLISRRHYIDCTKAALRDFKFVEPSTDVADRLLQLASYIVGLYLGAKEDFLLPKELFEDAIVDVLSDGFLTLSVSDIANGLPQASRKNIVSPDINILLDHIAMKLVSL